ncbi:hypothetical protein GCG54_00005801 [Colletotrichum gloeosporioides]|uniref:Uncharacterized protein n=1 Tax=Colletotrichum gloeosporioides TaxID=474922 RepID=A0A8H4FKA1_COLGL|nr:uncharacterized protein GCG54_00005801 [Colletotrichum gloeosporioides]KAF3805056.1 hypothetical protein GCG54_00005801 [Colletotrichum gloeosporioides]
MSDTFENMQGGAGYHARCMQWMEDSKPSDAPVDFSNSYPNKSNINNRSNTIGSPDIYEHLAVGNPGVARVGSFGGGRVKQLVAGYEARSRRTEELAEEAARRKQETTKALQSAAATNILDEDGGFKGANQAAGTPSEAICKEKVSDLEDHNGELEDSWYQVNKGSDLD